jgi:hypothetical protein
MDADTLGLLMIATMAVTVVSAATWRLRPDLRHSWVLGSVLGVSAVSFIVLVLFWVSFFAVFSALGDLRG